MDEVDKIIIHTLKQLDCKIETENDDDTICSLENFTPDYIVAAVSRCLEEIHLTKQQQNIPKSLPKNMAQRFTVATTLAELCRMAGYRGDIGYQTFLYPNVIDVRRLFMYLIECLPKEQETNLENNNDELCKSAYAIAMREVKQKLSQQLNAPWLPQYCRHIAANKELWADCISLNIPFQPLLNLTLPPSSSSSTNSTKHQWPNVFQQITDTGCDLISSVLHKNALDIWQNSTSSCSGSMINLQLPPNNLSICSHTNEAIEAKQIMYDEHGKDEISNSFYPTEIEKISQEIQALKSRNKQILHQRNEAINKLNDLNQQTDQLILIKNQLSEKIEFHERCALILQNPTENIQKLKELIEKTKTRRQTLENKWQEHKNAALHRLQELETSKKTKQLCILEELYRHIKELESELQEKNNRQMQLRKEVKMQDRSVASRIEYTRRIHEIIGSIRKQGNDINNILEDTRELQKQLNTTTAQLQRQFNYTDDLLFQNAKYDQHAKQAYKLLANLHTSCNEICTLVSKTGQTAKDLLELEVQIDYERRRNVAANLKQITIDIQNIQEVIKNLEADIDAIKIEKNH